MGDGRDRRPARAARPGPDRSPSCSCVQFGLRLSACRPVARRALTAASILAGVGILLAAPRSPPAPGGASAEWEAAVEALVPLRLLLPGGAAVGRSASGASAPSCRRRACPASGPTPPPPPAVLGGLRRRGRADRAPDRSALGAGDRRRRRPGSASTGLPLEVMRGVAGLALCVLAVKLLEIFDVEAKQRLEALDRARAVAEERARFGRDLHDGTIQSIYAAGPAPGGGRHPLRGARGARSEVREVVAGLNAGHRRASATTSARCASPPATRRGGRGRARRPHPAVRRGDRRAPCASAREGVDAAGPLPDEAGQHLEQILREALSNTARHAGAVACQGRAGVRARRARPARGRRRLRHRRQPPEREGRQGLRNMRERARRLGGRAGRRPVAAAGRASSLAVPLDSEAPEASPPIRDPDRRSRQ